MAKKLALGKGIASLIQTSSNDVEPEVKTSESSSEVEKVKDDEATLNQKKGDSVLMVEIKDIKLNPNQPRKIFKEKDLDELSDSIKENGIIQPLLVIKNDDGEYELIAGERRLRAAKKADLSEVPVIVKKATERDKMIMSIIENVQRADLNCVEEALAYYQLMDDYKLTQVEVAQRVGKERSSVANFLRILKLPRKVIEYVQKDQLSFGHAKVLASISDREQIENYAERVIAGELSVRELEKMVKAKKLGKEVPTRNPFFDEKIDGLRLNLEKKTGFHFAINSKKSGVGQISLKFNNEAEFNDIYEFLLQR